MTSHPLLDPSTELVLGLAATAMPFAESADEQAERWLRLLRAHGSSALLLASLGVTEHPLQPEPTWMAAPEERASDAAQRVTEVALCDASERGAEHVETIDVLAAVVEVYDEAFATALERHGGDPQQLRELLELQRSVA